MIENRYLAEWESGSLPVVPIADERLNMFRKYGVEMFALAGCAVPLQSLKLPAVEGMLRDAKERGIFRRGDVLVEATSGRAGNALLHRARAEPYGASDIILVMRSDVPRAKSGAPQVAGAIIRSEEPGLSPIATARKMAGGGWKYGGWEAGTWKGRRILNLDQYANPAAQTLYREWVAPKIAAQIDSLDILVAPVGTGATVCGLSEGLRHRFQKIAIVGAMCSEKSKRNEIPGMRDLKGMAEITQPWREALDYRIEVERDHAFLCAPWIDWLTGIPAGPSGGAAYAAACLFLNNLVRGGNVDAMRNPETGKVRLLFVIHDDVMPYVADRFMTEYKPEHFHLSTAQLPEQILFD